MKIGLIGLPNSGKTTIFNALTESEAEVTAYAGVKAEPNIAVVEVRDERVVSLSDMYCPRKTTFATIEIVDFAGFSSGSAGGNDFSSRHMALIKNLDAIALVIRNFHDDLRGDPDPMRDIETIETELILSDLIVTENRLERIEWSYKRGKKTNELRLEEEVLRKIHDRLSNGDPVRGMELNMDEQKAISGFRFATQKPLLVILNSSEVNFGRNDAVIEKLETQYRVIEFAGMFEMELSRLSDEEEAQLFMEDMGITESAGNRLTWYAYEILGYISFLTVGTDEVRAWTIHRGDTAVEAARVIHSDLARGFIRAECFSYNDLIELGSEKAIRDKGRFRLEGKEYIVTDGDILSIRSGI
jgi:GTP-binding protein YchF